MAAAPGRSDRRREGLPARLTRGERRGEAGEGGGKGPAAVSTRPAVLFPSEAP